MSKRLALIIANSEFDDPALAGVLGDPAIGGFDEVDLLVDRTQREVQRGIARLYHRRKRGDLLLLYYSGHGIRDDDGNLYLAVRDTEKDFPSATGVDAAFVRGQLDKSSSQRKVVALDCCHSGAFVRGAKAALGGSAGTQEAFAGSGYGRVILTSSNALEYAWEGDKLPDQVDTSVFTHFLVQGLRSGAADLNGSGSISLDELYDYVYEQVVTSSQSRQTPCKWAQKVEGGSIIIARNPHLKPAKLPAELQQALQSDLAWVRLGAVSGLARLLGNQDEELALAARQALTHLADDDSRQVSLAAGRALGSSAPPPAKIISNAPSPRPGGEFAKVRLPLARMPFEPEMILIPAGEFLMGSDPKKDKQAHGDEQPQHSVCLPDHYLAKTPATNAQYAAFVGAAGCDPPKHWQDGKPPPGKEEHSVVSVFWHDALAYCRWLAQATGKRYRLPTEAEWEKAARSDDGRIYPWGDQWDAKRCNSQEGGKRGTTPVGAYPLGANSYGLLDMAGNVWEWVNDWYQSDYYQGSPSGNPSGPGSGEYKVLRGGSFHYNADDARAASRHFIGPDNRNHNVGLRCVVEPGG